MQAHICSYSHKKDAELCIEAYPGGRFGMVAYGENQELLGSGDATIERMAQFLKEPAEKEKLVVPGFIKTNKIGFLVAGPMYAGKSLFSRYISAGGPVDWQVKPMALRLKQLVADYHGISLADLEANKVKYRFDLQWMGTDVMRLHYAEDFWVRLWLNDPHPYVVVDDIRYPNEREEIVNACGRIYSVWIDADEEVRKKRCESKFGPGSYKGTSHSSEKGFTGEEDFWDFKFMNNYDDPGPLKLFAMSVLNVACEDLNNNQLWP